MQPEAMKLDSLILCAGRQRCKVKGRSRVPRLAVVIELSESNDDVHTIRVVA